MAKTVAEKLLIKPGSALWTSDVARVALAEPLPDNVQLVMRADEAGVALVFAPDAATLAKTLRTHGARLAQAPTVWVLYPKGNATDLNRDTLWPKLTEYGLRPNQQVSVDDTWSALRFRPLKPGEEPFNPGQS